jgi:hypothetical protein
MDAQYKLKYALQTLRDKALTEEMIGKVNKVMNMDGELDAENNEIFDSVNSYIDEVDEQSNMFHKELGAYRFFHDSPLKSDSAKVSAFSESVELICGLAPEKVAEMLRLVEKMNMNPSTQTTIEQSNGCILVKKVMRRILPEHQSGDEAK